MQKQNKFNWKVFLTLWFAAIVGTLAVLPYALTLQASAIEKITATVPFGVLLVVQIIQSVVMFG
ncbi:MAG: CPBP family intramembrane glutamate endopeptidase, partial [Anaerolineales bacterium]